MLLIVRLRRILRLFGLGLRLPILELVDGLLRRIELQQIEQRSDLNALVELTLTACDGLVAHDLDVADGLPRRDDGLNIRVLGTAIGDLLIEGLYI